MSSVVEKSEASVGLSRLRERKELAFARKGMFLALFSVMIWSFDGLALSKGLSPRH